MSPQGSLLELRNIVCRGCVKVPLVATDKRGVIDELVDVLTANGCSAKPDALKEAIWTREQTRTTGIGQGLAIPHGKCAGMTELAMAFGKPAKPMDFEAIDQKPVKLIVLLASPPDRTSDHIQALAHISRLLVSDEFRQSIYDADDADALWDLLSAKL